MFKREFERLAPTISLEHQHCDLDRMTVSMTGSLIASYPSPLPKVIVGVAKDRSMHWNWACKSTITQHRYTTVQDIPSTSKLLNNTRNTCYEIPTLDDFKNRLTIYWLLYPSLWIRGAPHNHKRWPFDVLQPGEMKAFPFYLMKLCFFLFSFTFSSSRLPRYTVPFLWSFDTIALFPTFA